ncbi:MAG: F0F1 ATP synthase subunit delta [Bacteroides sp.]|nr:F0F1 ATP synthase subunit delta [Bacteroidales bacterium]MBD5284046.1 F0F1 ATP synthase subunit delta [Bacteroides sp.]MBD5336073.1 F0F1 ATP synthase subunit delta [Bacteroides sp.]
MSNGLIPRRYAKALYKYAEEKGNTETVYTTMKALADAFKTNPDLQKVLANPFVEKEDKEKLLVSAVGPDAPADYVDFVKLLLENKREEFTNLIAIAYCDLYRNLHHIARVTVTSATPLTGEQLDKIRTIIDNAYKGWTVELSTAVDPALIGGFVIDAGNNRLDASLSNELDQLRLNLLRS